MIENDFNNAFKFAFFQFEKQTKTPFHIPLLHRLDNWFKSVFDAHDILLRVIKFLWLKEV